MKQVDLQRSGIDRSPAAGGGLVAVDGPAPSLRDRASDRHRRTRVVGFAFVLAAALTTGMLAGSIMRGAGGAPAAPATATAVNAAFSPPDRSPSPRSSPSPSASAAASPSTGPTPSHVAIAGPVDINLAPHATAVFSSQITKEMCASAGLTSALATMGLVQATNAVQQQINGRLKPWWSWDDSHNYGWGPLAMTKALATYGAPGYVVRVFTTRDAALRAAGIALSATHEPVLLLAWWGAHTWVMTGYRATGDLATDAAARFTGAYIVDPWYPRVSSIWGHVQPPGHFYDMAGMIHNYIAWTRPEGRYPTRDGKWVAVVPTQARPGGGA